MSWIDEDKRNWRRLFLFFLLVPVVGPWFFERLSVPEPHSCSGIRLDENFCGTPTTVLVIFLATFGGLFNTGKGLLTQSMGIAAWSRLFFISLLLLLILSPFLSTMFVILRVNQRRWHLCHMIVLGLAAAGIILLMGMSIFSRPHWLLWGPWLYISLAIIMLLWETFVFYKEREEYL
jgi:hypothetical protein